MTRVRSSGKVSSRYSIDEWNSQERRVDVQRLQELIKIGMAPASLALKERLVTALGYEDEIQTKLLPEKNKEYRSVSIGKYLKAVRDGSGKKARQRVALIGGLGPITSGEGNDVWGNVMGGETMASRLREIRKDKEVKGVLFRVNSPGGSAVGSWTRCGGRSACSRLKASRWW
jgi:protease-4